VAEYRCIDIGVNVKFIHHGNKLKQLGAWNNDCSIIHYKLFLCVIMLRSLHAFRRNRKSLVKHFKYREGDTVYFDKSLTLIYT
jgi:hypothetical protein